MSFMMKFFCKNFSIYELEKWVWQIFDINPKHTNISKALTKKGIYCLQKFTLFASIKASSHKQFPLLAYFAYCDITRSLNVVRRAYTKYLNKLFAYYLLLIKNLLAFILRKGKKELFTCGFGLTSLFSTSSAGWQVN